METGVLRLGKGISADDVEVTRIENNLVFIIGSDKERVTVQNWYVGTIRLE